ncbi:MAG: DNA mismatch endonuclease Vsr [Candidatus Brockarchaeota archaeon]|nr:DNA mismatch endonuclease Vsr [Candidatus Brockarchaeota archaeon]
MDRITKEKRSWNMSRIRSKNTGPERLVRSCLRRLGIRFSSYGKSITGNPDIILQGRKIALFVHGCFWHRHNHCPYAYVPKSRVSFWRRKFQRNIARDRFVRARLLKEGWTVAVVWECQTRDRDSLENRLRTLLMARRR